MGQVLSEDGIKPPDSYIKAVKDWQLPTFKTEARAFLRVTGYYRQLIKDYAQIAATWTSVIGKSDKEAEKTALVVTKEMRDSFEALKQGLVTAPVLGFPYFQGPKAGKFTLDTDFCKEQIYGILSQNQNGKEIVIAYGSKKLSKSQKNWASTRGELFAGIYWMGKYQYHFSWDPI